MTVRCFPVFAFSDGGEYVRSRIYLESMQGLFLEVEQSLFPAVSFRPKRSKVVFLRSLRDSLRNNTTSWKVHVLSVDKNATRALNRGAGYLFLGGNFLCHVVKVLFDSKNLSA